ncbi:MAG: hypothetical protein ACJAT2_000758 [Bacteriovoracaceae bacterium]|jgi:hypothetical protein
MFFLRSLLVLAVFFIAASSFASGPHYKILRAKENFVKSTQLGRLHAGFYENDHGADLIRFGTMKEEYETKSSFGKKTLKLNWALRAAGHEYISWILFQGLVRYDLEKKLGGVKLPHMIEMDYYIFKKSMEYLDQTGMIISDDMDYANHPTFNFGRNRLLSISLFYDLWLEDERLFLQSVWVRREKLSGKVESVLDYLNRRNLKAKQRTAAEELKSLWYDYAKYQ